MSIRQKEFEKAIQKARNDMAREPILGMRKLGETYIRFLKYSNGMYSQSAIKSIEKTVIKKYEGEEIPPELHKLILETAKYYSRVGDYESAMSVLAEIINSRNVTICIQAQYEANMIRLKQDLEQGKLDTSVINDLKKNSKDDEEHVLDTVTRGEVSDYDIFCSYFGDRISIDGLSDEIFPANMQKPTNTKGNSDVVIPGPKPEIPTTSSYIEELSANNRLKFLMENFNIAYARPGEGKFTGDILFEIEGSDVVIVESFWKQGKDGQPPVEDYGKATYILPKDQAMDLIQLSRGEIRARKDPRIGRVEHYSKKYYTYLVERFNEVQSAQFEKVQQKTNLLDNEEQVIEPEEQPNSDIVEPQVENPNISPNEQLSDNSRTEITNEEFLNMINQNLGGIITPDLMEGLLKRASYSFENLYVNKLKEDIVDRLKFLEVEDELLETEAQKVFLYIRMTKNISMINSGSLNGKNLSDVLDDSVVEYADGMKFFEKHIADGLSYNEMKKAIKQFIETGKDPFEQEEVLQDTSDAPSIEEETTGVTIPSEPSQPEEQTEQDLGILDALLGKKVSKEVGIKTIGICTRFLELIKRNEELEIEAERAKNQLAEKEKQHELRQQATLQAQEQERQARLATQDAMEQEAISSQELLAAQQAKEKIDREHQELREKISQLEDMLR